MIILGIGDSHESHACVLRDGHLVAAIAEERLSRLKADMGYPRRAIEAALAIAGVTPEEVDLVAYAGLGGNAYLRLYKRSALFSVADWVRQNHEYFRPKLLGGARLTAIDDFNANRHLRTDMEEDFYWPFVDRAGDRRSVEWPEIFRQVRIEAVGRHLGIPAGKVHFFRHEDCHQAYGWYSHPQRPKRALVFTVEGGGDDSSATLWIQDGTTRREVWRTNDCSLGRLYRNMTLLLGMKPGQHEYKVMGLAPYGNAHGGGHALDLFRRVDAVCGTTIRRRPDFPDLYFSLRDALEGQRFDGIAWGLQTYLEEILSTWVSNAIQIHGISDVILSGGVAQNIKACKAVAERTQATSVWSGPVAGDGSLGIGAAFLAHEDATGVPPIGLTTAYLGSAHDMAVVKAAMAARPVEDDITIIENPPVDRVAGWLAAGAIGARFAGRMEFGQRALGNRSILADPRVPETIERINNKVKFRDFWMPFTPSILAEEEDRYLINPENTPSPFMTRAFDSTEAARRALPAALHPADKTVRPQILRRTDNPAYHDLISAFQRRTGVGALLNTSFNLHGEAIVESPEDALSAFGRSDIDILLFEGLAIARKGVARFEATD
ncbi:MAG: hypothetical protein K9H25_17415 [Rhodospirillum sp.]|nr:hypothetical protein [Rhodospirillum sp.]MCF8490780.1 hypothetical protein [Rhodospirillum sp.]MCF8499841.1 hypothetical protein [Rhodospirillum sp.]